MPFAASMRLIWRTSIRKPFSLMTQLARLRGVKTLPQLARVLGVQPASLSFVLYWLPDEQKYEQFTIPKKGGGWRLITAPKPRLKMIQTKLADLLLDIHVELEQSRSRSQCRLAHGFKRDFSIVTNATAHRNKRFVFNADLKDFFPSINFGRIRGFFQWDNNFSLDPKVATVIAQIACRDNQLPQGSPCSPVISNLIAHILDIHLNRLARAGRCTYTRYVDDITFSTNEKEFPSSIARLVRGSTDKWVPGDSLVKRVYSSGYSLNYDKTRMQRRDSRQDTTGLIVNKKVNVRNEYYKTARAKCDHLFKNGFCFSDKDRKPISDDAMDGTMGFIRQIRGLKTKDWQSEQNSFFKLYRQFLDYRAFHGIIRPKIICEGKTDNIYLRCAFQRLRARFPSARRPNPNIRIELQPQTAFLEIERNSHAFRPTHLLSMRMFVCHRREDPVYGAQAFTDHLEQWIECAYVHCLRVHDKNCFVASFPRNQWPFACQSLAQGFLDESMNVQVARRA